MSTKPKVTAADGVTEVFNIPGYPLMVRAVDFNAAMRPAAPTASAITDEQIDWRVVGVLIEAHMTASRHHTAGTSNWGAALYRALRRAAPASPQGDAAQPAERNQCDGCAVGAYVNRWGNHCMPDGGRMACTKARDAAKPASSSAPAVGGVAPCPFCGGTNISAAEGSTFRWWVASCNECGACAGEARRQTLGDGTNAEWDAKAKADALKEWNTRAAPAGAAGQDAARYRAFFDCGLPITFLGVEYRSKAALDAAIDEHLAAQGDGGTTE